MRASSNRVLSRTLKLASSAGAIVAVLALAGTALTQEGPKDERVLLEQDGYDNGTEIGKPARVIRHQLVRRRAFNRYYLGDRSNKAVDVIIPPSHARPIHARVCRRSWPRPLSHTTLAAPDEHADHVYIQQ